MKSLKKILWTLMILVLVALSIAIVFAIKSNNIYLVYKRQNFGNWLLPLAIIFFAIAFILFIDLVTNLKYKSDLLFDEEDGSVYISRKSLESALENSAKRFSVVVYAKARVQSVKDKKLEGRLSVITDKAESFNELGKEIKEEAIKGLKTLTGIDDITLDVDLREEAGAKDGK